MKIYIIPHEGPKEFKLNDFYREERWKNLLTKDQLLALDIIPMGGELEIDALMGKPVIIMRIL